MTNLLAYNDKMFKYLATIITILIFLNVNGQNSKSVLLSEFKKTESNQIFGSSLKGTYQFYHESAPMGDFLSRLWSNFGETKDYGYDGFTYVIEHIPTGIVFRAYTGMAGPSFGGFDNDEKKLKEVLDKFQLLLKESNYVDCELIFHTDYGKMKVGCKNGTPYDIILKEE
jgi:hypothetical protein